MDGIESFKRRQMGKTACTISVLHDAQILLNKQQQIWGGSYIHWDFSGGTDTIVLQANVAMLDIYETFNRFGYALMRGEQIGICCASKNGTGAIKFMPCSKALLVIVRFDVKIYPTAVWSTT